MWPFSCRPCKLREEENARLWDLIRSMRAVTIDPPPQKPVVNEYRQRTAEPEVVQEPHVFNRYTEREIFIEKEEEQ